MLLGAPASVEKFRNIQIAFNDWLAPRHYDRTRKGENQMQTTQTPNPAILAPHVYASGAVGITRGQTARWNVVNPKIPAPTAGGTCSVTLSIANSNGNVLKSESVS